MPFICHSSDATDGIPNAIFALTAALPAQVTLVLTETRTGTTLLPGAGCVVPITATTGVYTQVVSVGLRVSGARVYLPRTRR